ncbi:secreted protein containing DUF1566 [Candidatus Magnetobacterium bavaricum]|uniref:Secreted protein containing DUF1566 n=1 Tax=Candidatus Magnetobacterium bavaricum TaxID=29290 RepID=A0A0F3GY81_9BACT|nr:secreted protein containing DUF1566 [Candidatus Magnetobacterium bavaricum]
MEDVMFKRCNNQREKEYLRFHKALGVRLLFTLALIVVIGGMWLSGAVYAGTVSLPQTGQVKSYTDGDDGAIKAGVAWPSPRFKDNGDKTVTDNLTGMVWGKDGGTPTVGSCTGGYKTWQKALDYVACLNSANYLGHSDWRLPNVNELESLTNAGQVDAAAWLNSGGFVSVMSSPYWTSTTYSTSADTSNAWVVYMGIDSTWWGNMGRGIATANKTDNYYVLVVRLGQSGAFGNAFVWATGQLTSYAPGDDGDLKTGVAWPNPRFTDNGDGTVTDNLTGLVWSRDAGAPKVGSCAGGGRYWPAALDYVKCLNAAKYLGYGDWRLPNKKELYSLIDHGRYSPALSSDYPFINANNDFYHSSNTNADYDYRVWGVNMADGNITDYPGYRSDAWMYVIWPVRGGQVSGSVNLTVSKTGTGAGIVTSDDGKINCGPTCSAAYSPGATVILTAKANDNSAFVNWSGDCTGTGTTCKVTVSADKKVTATFTSVSNPTPSPTSNPTPTPSPTSNPTPTPSPTSTPTPGQVKLTVTKLGCGDGTVTAVPGPLSCSGKTCTTPYDTDTSVTLTASPVLGSTVKAWTGCDLNIGANQCMVKMTADKSVSIEFDGGGSGRKVLGLGWALEQRLDKVYFSKSRVCDNI